MTKRTRLRIDARIERIERSCEWLASVAARDRDTVLASIETVAAVERMLEIAVQATIDVASHLVAAEAWPTPETYAQAFAVLEVRGVLPAELAKNLRRAVGLRNALAHDYLDIDVARMLASLPADIADLRAFCAAVTAWVAKAP
ncbi:MAG: hypothetical protein AMXMBFR64_43570 [Myxococcales bacterium]